MHMILLKFKLVSVLPFGSLLEIEILKCKVNTISRSLATYVAIKPSDSVHYLLGTKLYIPSTRSAHAAVIKFEQFYISDWLSVLADIIIDYQLLYYVYGTYSIQACTIFVHTHTHTHTCHTHTSTQSSIKDYIGYFEPLVVLALRQFSYTSSLLLQQRVLFLLVQLLHLKVV